MFRILKLEDRIVLDAAFMDALEEQQDEGVHEEVVGNDEYPDSSEWEGVEFDAPMAAFTDEVGDGVHVLVVSSDVYEAEDIAAAARDDIIVVRYASDSSLEDLSGTIEEALKGYKADSIAFATHNAGDAKVQLTNDHVVSAENLQEGFWNSLGGLLKDGGRIDLLACNVLPEDTDFDDGNLNDGEKLLQGIEEFSGAKVAASTDYTGSEAYGGDWVLESEGLDIHSIYFDSEKIDAYQGILNQDVVVNQDVVPDGLLDQSAQAGNFWAYALSEGTFVDPNPGPNAIDYNYTITQELPGSDGTFADPSWIKFYEPTQVFYGTPPAGSAEGDIYTVTLQASDETDIFTNAAELQFTLTIADFNQNVPVYNNPALITVAEYSGTAAGTEVGEAIATIKASDADNQPLTYEVVEGGDIFAIDNSGVLTLKDEAGAKLFDYETSGASNHRFTVTLQATDPDGLSDTAKATIEVTDVEPEATQAANTATLDIVPDVFPEQGGTATLYAYLDSPATQNLTVGLNYTAENPGTIAGLGTDFSGAASIEILAGETSGQIQLSGLTDTVNDPDELVEVSIGTISDSNIVGSTAAATATITEETFPTVSLSIQGNNQISENGDTTQVNAVLTGETQGESLSVSVLFPASDPDLGSDYTASATEIIIPAGATQGTSAITLTGLTDTIENENEVISMKIDPAGVSGYIADTQPADVAIIDFVAGPKPNVSIFPSTFNVDEGNLFTITAQLDSTATQNVTVYLDFSDPNGSVAPGDLAIWAGTDGSVADADFSGKDSITIFKDSASNKISITAMTDLLNEDAEEIVVTVDAARTVDANLGSNPSTTVTLNDDTPPEIVLSATPNTIFEDSGTDGVDPQSSVITASVIGGETLSANATVFINMGGSADETSDFTITQTDGATPISPTVQSGENTYKLIIPAGASSGSIQVNAVADGVYDGAANEIIEASIFSANGVIDGGTPELATVDIVDADQSLAPTVTLSVGTGQTEGMFAENSSLNLNVNLNQLSTQATVTAAIDLSEILGIPQPELGGDFTAKVDGTDVPVDANGRLLVDVEPGFLKTTVTLEGLTDTIFEGDEEARLTLTGVTNGVIGTGDMVEIELEDINIAPTITLSTDTAVFYENPQATDGSEPGSVDVTISITPGDTIVNPLTVELTPSAATALGEAAADSDYVVKDAGGQTVSPNADGDYALVFSSGDTGTVLTLEAIDDNFPEGDESFTMDFSTDTQTEYNTVGGPATFTIIDDEGAPTGVTLSVATDTVTSVAEDGGVSTITVELSDPLSGNQSVDLDLSGSTATLGGGDPWAASTPVDVEDYIVPTTLDGYFFKAIDIAGTTDTSGTTSATIEPSWPTIANGTVSDNGVIWQNQGRYDYVLQTSDGEYLFSTTGTVTLPIAEGETAVDVTLMSRVDNLFEGTAGEDVFIQLANPTLGMLQTPDSVSVNIEESLNAPNVFLNVSNSTIAESGGAAQVIAELEHPTTQDIVVNLAYTETGSDPATINDDYLTVSDSITIEAGFTANSTGVQAVSDKILEGDETFKVSIVGASSGDFVTLSTNPADIEEILTIIDDDADGAPQVMLRFDGGADTASFSENDGTVNLNVTLDRPVSETVGVELNFATAGIDVALPEDDYSADGYTLSTDNPLQLILNPNETQATVVLRGLDDTVREGDELAPISLGAITGGETGKLPEASPGFTQVTATIVDDEQPPQADLVWNVDQFTEGTSAKLLVQLDQAADSSITIPVTFGSTEPNEADFNTDYLPSGGQTEIVVSAGATQGELKVFAYDADGFELDEIISVTIDQASITDDVGVGVDSDVVTILDPTPKPEVALAVTGATDVQESGGNTTLTLSLSSTDVTALEDVTVQVNLAGLTYGTDGDYTLQDGTNDIDASTGSFTYTFTEGAAASKDFTLTFIDDSETTGDQFFSPRIDGPSLPTTVVDTVADEPLIIVRDDEFIAQTVELVPEPGDLVINEEFPGDTSKTPPGQGWFFINLSGNVLPEGALVTLNFGGSAEVGTDYILASDFAFNSPISVTPDGNAEITMVQGQTQATVYIRPIDDDDFEGGTVGEPFQLAVEYTSSDNISTGGAVDNLTGSIYEEDAPPVISLLPGDPSTIIEGTQGAQGTGTITLQLDTASFQDTIVDMQIIQSSTDGPVADYPGDFTIAIEAGLNAPDWQAGSYNEGDYVVPALGGDYYYRVVAADDLDTSSTFDTGATEPDFATAPAYGNTVGDGELVWQNMGEIVPTVTDGGGTVPDDFKVIIPAGETEFGISLTPVPDNLKELDELAVLSLVGTGGADYSVDTTADESVITIEDDDVGPEFSFNFSKALIDEGGTTVGTLSLELAGTSGADTTVTMSFTGEAVFGADEPWASGTVVEAGDLIIPSPTANGHYYEAVSGGTTGASAPSFPVNGGTVTEGTDVEWKDMGIYDYLLGGSTEIDNWSQDTDTGITTVDLLIPAGATSAAYTVEGVTDGIFEGPEQFTIDVAAVIGAENTAPETPADVTIVDEQNGPTISFSVTEGTLPESGNLILTLTSDVAVTVPTKIYLNDGNADTAEEGVDYDLFASAGGGTEGDYFVTLPAGETSVQVPLEGITDTIFEGEGTSAEVFTLSISSIMADLDGDGTETSIGSAGTDGTFDGVMSDTSEKGEVSLTIDPADGRFDESGQATTAGTAQLNVVLSGGTSAFDETVTLDFSTVAAVMGEDYQVLDGTDDVTPATDASTVDVTISAGATQATLTLVGLSDTISEGDEEFTISLGTVGADQGIQNDVSVGDDVTATVVDLTPDPVVSLDLSTPFGGTEPSTEDPEDSLFWEGTGMGATQEETTAIVKLSLDRANDGGDVSVPLDFSTMGAVPGTHFQVLDGTLDITPTPGDTALVTIPAGATETTVTLQAIDDPLGTAPAFEGDLDLSVTMVTDGLMGALLTTVPDDVMESATILDDEEAPEVALHINSLTLPDREFSEGNGSAWVTATLDQPTNRPVTVTLDLGFTDSEAELGVDYSAQPSDLVIDIPAGATIGTNQVNLTGIPDSIYEGDEAFTIGIADVTNARPAQPLEDWGSGTDYDLGDQILDTTSGYIFEVTNDGGTSGTTEPTWIDGVGDLVGETIADSGLTWTNLGLADFSDIPEWGAEADVTTGDTVAPGNGYYYEVTDAGPNGITGLNEPVWPETPGSTVVDNGVVWTIQGQGAPQAQVVGVVVDDDPGPTVSLSIDPANGEIQEEGGVAKITVSLTGTEINPDVDETVYLNFPTDPTDFQATWPDEWGLYETAGTTGAAVPLRNDAGDDLVLGGDELYEVVITAGQTSTEVYLISLGDGVGSAGIYEPDETVTIGIDDVANDTLQVDTAADEVTATIIDDDEAAAKNVSLSFASDSFVDAADVAETEGAVLNFYVNLDGISKGDVKTTIDIDGGSSGDPGFAEYGVDYTVGADDDGDGQITVTVTAGATSVAVPITILNDDVFENPETIDISLDTAGVIGGLVQAGQDAIIGTITDDADTPNIFIYVSNNAADTAYGDWEGTAAVTAGDDVAPDNGWRYEALNDGTTGAVTPAWPTEVNATVVDGPDNGGLWWSGNEAFYAWASLGSYNPGDDVLVTATTGESFLFDVGGGGTAFGPEPDWSSASNVGETVADGAGIIYTNVGEVETTWAPSETIQAGDLIAPAGETVSFMALDDGITGATAPAWPGVNGIVRDGDNASPVVWEARGMISDFNGSVDETDQDNLGNFFIIGKDLATEEIVTVKWEIDPSTTAEGQGVDPFEPYDYATQPVGQTAGQVFLPKDAFSGGVIPINILGDQFDETAGDLTIRITDVEIGGNIYAGTDTTVVTNQKATLTITDVEPDLQPDGSTLPADATPAMFVNDGLDTTEVSEGGVATIGTDDLQFTDADHPDTADLTYTVTVTPTTGTLFLDANQDGILDDGEEITTGTEGINTFTQMDIDDGKLLYQHNGNSATLEDEFKFHVSDPAPNTSYENFDTAGNPIDWTFSITAADVPEDPVIDENVFWINDEVSGQVWADPNGTELGGPLATDDDVGDILAFQVQDEDGTWVGFDVYPHFELDPDNQLVVSAGEELDWEIQSSHTLQVRVTDDTDGAGDPLFGAVWQESTFVVFVNEPAVPEFDTGAEITPSPQPIDSESIYIFQIPDEVFIDASIVTYGYSATSSLGGGATLLDWLYFNQETQTFVFNPLEPSWPEPPTQDQVFTIEVTATYWHDNFPVQPKGEVIKTFQIDYDYIASLETGMLENALEYLEGDGDGELQLEDDGIEIQEFMVAGIDPSRVQEAADSQVDNSLSEVLDLLEGEVLVGEPKTPEADRKQDGDVGIA